MDKNRFAKHKLPRTRERVAGLNSGGDPQEKGGLDGGLVKKKVPQVN